MRADKPSATAFLIARSTFFLSRDPLMGRFVPDASATLSREFIETRPRSSRVVDAAIHSRILKPVAWALERMTIPGIKLHYALRKRYLETVARDALGNGTTQAVILGAGFDTLALRLHHEFPKTQFFEIDHPATQEEKKNVIHTANPARSNFHLVALDLAKGNPDRTLAGQAEYQPRSKTLVIAEGLLMYFSPADVELLFESIRRIAGPGSRVAFTFVEKDNDGRIGFRNSTRLVDWWLRLRGESFRWGISRDEIEPFLAERGYEAISFADSETLRKMYLTQPRMRKLRLADGEHICVAKIV